MTGRRGDVLELLEAFPGDPLQISTVLGGEGSLERPSVRVLGGLAVLGAVVVHGVDGQALGATVDKAVWATRGSEIVADLSREGNAATNGIISMHRGHKGAMMIM